MRPNKKYHDLVVAETSGDSLVDRVDFLGHVHLKRRREGSFTRPVKTGFGAYADRGASFLHGIESESERHLSVDRVEESFRSAT